MLWIEMGLPAPNRKSGGAADDLLDQVDVPATVVCARCGSVDCPGCEHDETLSGVIAIVAWERRDAPFLRRLWMTARATTRDPESFFEALPDGPITPALSFALTSEILAASAMIFALLPLVAIVSPLWAKELVTNSASRALAIRALVVGIPVLAGMLVLAHAAHGLALDIGARRTGARPERTRALRFGLYATGWDLVLGPLGALIVALTEGLSSAAALGKQGMKLPGASARAFLRGAYHLYDKRADGAMRVAYLTAAIFSVLVATAVLGFLVALALA
ncbi:hypothetical protein [Pendulispora albinea]|uniref:DUF3667 domain-containing protein n=1 Tax=Pendulispora albinea TaxID=2741071 RepID=A0ABZ2LSZ4_9BACT